MVKILLFAELQEFADTQEIILNEESITVKEVKQLLVEYYQIKQLDACMAAIDEEFAGEDDIVQSGQTLAFLPPVSGG
ncbi:molybdopterin converting factor subunit 1 [Bacillus lacus]|uniref:Molybdopterin synthase sulfur carrier subunit n=1 Tax=Metabacillus lacus TaxID=1983721 RepID=A0A7X2IXR5_9BACI|nr:molybdopterin converting factor subunit 1 [Metabacillus lacus]MRX71609.1 molybdopterin converting factor subunit 1 [Metabacillus lacus]